MLPQAAQTVNRQIMTAYFVEKVVIIHGGK